MNDLSKACLDEARNSMKSSLSFLEKELAKIRAGKANPGMLDGVKVEKAKKGVNIVKSGDGKTRKVVVK